MKTTIFLSVFILPLLAALAETPADKGIYQWGVEMEGVISKETKKPPRAYLWIPEGAKSLKAAGDATRREILRANGKGELLVKRTLPPWSLVLIREM